MIQPKRARGCLWEKAGCTCWKAEPPLASLPFVEQGTNPTEQGSMNILSAWVSAGGWKVERRGISSPASTVSKIVASFASTNPKDPFPRPELTLFCTCKQTTTNGKYWVCQSLTYSAQRQAHHLPQYSHQTRRSPPVSSWAWRAASVLLSGSDFLQVLEYAFLQPSEYRFLVCRLYGDYPAKECHH